MSPAPVEATGDPAQAPGAAAAVTVAMLAVLTASATTVSAVAVLAPEAAPAMGVDPKLIGGFISVTYVVAMFSGTATGGWMRRFGPIRVCQFALGCAAGGMAALATGWPLVAAFAAPLLGLCYGPFNPASADVLMRVSSPRRRALVFSIKQTGVPLGGAIAGAGVAPLAVAVGWREALLACAVAAVVVAVAVQPFRRRFDAGRDPGARSGRLDLAGPLHIALGGRRLRAFTFMAFAYAGCQVSIGSFFVVFLTERLSMSLVAAGVLFAFVQGGGFAGRILWGSVGGPRLRAGPLLAALGAAVAASLVAVAAIDGQWSWAGVAILATALGMCSFGWNGVLLAEVAALAPPGRAGEATGGLQFVMFGGVVVFPPAFGALAASAGFGAAFLALAGLAAVGALLAALGGRV